MDSDPQGSLSISLENPQPDHLSVNLAEIDMITKVYAHILDEDGKINAQEFESAFYSNPDLRNVKPPEEPKQTVDISAPHRNASLIWLLSLISPPSTTGMFVWFLYRGTMVGAIAGIISIASGLFSETASREFLKDLVSIKKIRCRVNRPSDFAALIILLLVVTTPYGSIMRLRKRSASLSPTEALEQVEMYENRLLPAAFPEGFGDKFIDISVHVDNGRG